jgi:hypothetical protein
VLPDPARHQAKKVLDHAFEAASEALVADHSELRTTEQENARVLNTRGDLPEALATEYERLRKSYEALHRWAGVGWAWGGGGWMDGWSFEVGHSCMCTSRGPADVMQAVGCCYRGACVQLVLASEALCR